MWTEPNGVLLQAAGRRTKIAEGTDPLTGAIERGQAGSYQLQAAIAAVHDGAADAADTDWTQILGRLTRAWLR